VSPAAAYQLDVVPPEIGRDGTRRASVPASFRASVTKSASKGASLRAGCAVARPEQGLLHGDLGLVA